MKILQLCSYLYPALTYGGPAKMVYDLSLELAKKNQVIIYTTDIWDQKSRIKNKQKLKNTNNLNIKYFKNINNYLAFKLRLFTGFGMILEFIKNYQKFDLVHIHDIFILPQILIAYLCIVFNKAYIITPHGVLEPVRLNKKSILKKTFMILAWPMLKNAKYIIAVSNPEAKNLKKLNINKNIKIIYNGIIKLNIKASNKFNKYLPAGRQGKNNKNLKLLYIGKIHPQKGLKELVLALAELNFDYNLLIAGPDDGQQVALEKIIKNKKIKNIKFLGFVNDQEKLELFKLADLFVYPSYVEGFSISILESLQAGLPVLITQNCHFNDVKKYQAGLIIKNKNLEKNLVKALKFIKNHQKILKIFKKNTKKLIRQKYSSQIMAQNYWQTYEQII